MIVEDCMTVFIIIQRLSEMKKLMSFSFIAAVLGSYTPLTQAESFTVEIENLTRGLYFTPLLVAAHPEGTSLFQAGQEASTSLQIMAEGGDISSLAADLESLGASQANNPAEGLLAPGQSTQATLDTDDTENTLLTVVAMVLPSNDGFLGLNSIELPDSDGTYTYYVNAYDAGTEANDEVVGSGALGMPGFPAPPPLQPSLGVWSNGRCRFC